MDNVFCFHETIATTQSSHSPLACLLLDFEKAYERVECVFLEGSLQRLGFPDAWIKGATAFYRYVMSAITIGVFVGSSFTLTCSIRQGCPLQLIYIS